MDEFPRQGVLQFDSYVVDVRDNGAHEDASGIYATEVLAPVTSASLLVDFLSVCGSEAVSDFLLDETFRARLPDPTQHTLQPSLCCKHGVSDRKENAA